MAGLRDVPDGLVAWARPRTTAAGPRTDRKGRPKVGSLWLRSTEPGPPARPESLLSDGEWDWATGAARRWPTVVRRFGDRAGPVAEALARANCVELEHDR